MFGTIVCRSLEYERRWTWPSEKEEEEEFQNLHETAMQTAYFIILPNCWMFLSRWNWGDAMIAVV